MLTDKEEQEYRAKFSNLKDKNLEELEKLYDTTFEKLAMKYGSYSIFDDVLDMAINALSFNYQKYMDRLINKYSKIERVEMGALIQIWILIMDRAINKKGNSFYDFWGHKYEELSLSKKSGFAQYFTPNEIAILMVHISGESKQEEEQIAKFYEPSCGSGRFNLAFHTNKTNRAIHMATDLDFTCVKMAALNFFIHGIKGIVVCDDTLVPFANNFRGAFIINEHRGLGIYFTDDLNEVLNYSNFRFPNPRGKAKEENKEENKEEIFIVNGEQLTLF